MNVAGGLDVHACRLGLQPVEVGIHIRLGPAQGFANPQRGQVPGTIAELVTDGFGRDLQDSGEVVYVDQGVHVVNPWNNQGARRKFLSVQILPLTAM